MFEKMYCTIEIVINGINLRLEFYYSKMTLLLFCGVIIGAKEGEGEFEGM